MHALELQQLTGPDGLVLVEHPDPAPGDHVVIDVRAAGVSFPDLLVTQGRYQIKPQLPYITGMEVAGIVRSAPESAAVGEGDRVWASMPEGGFATVATASPQHTFPLTDRLSFEQGAALPVNYLTAVFALQRRAGVAAGETVLVLGAAGGVGTASVAVAKAYGASVTAVVSTAEKAQTAQAAGADDVIIGDAWRPTLLERTGGRGADVVVDVVGGAQTREAIRASAPEGAVLVVGYAGGDIPEIPTNRLLLRNVGLLGVGLGALDAVDPTVIPGVAEELMRLLDDDLGAPLVGLAVPLAEGQRALRALERREARGKVVLQT